ncbi:hypothetical protein I6J02_18095 [Sphingobacterium spiritivorum]|nr:hypothetical protein I6J02_18095 [Sphingobacterium spiritivorum]
MQQLVSLSQDELKRLKKKSRFNFWIVPVQMCAMAVIITWIFGKILIGLLVCAAVLTVYTIVSLVAWKHPSVTGNHKTIRRQIVEEVRIEGSGYKLKYTSVYIRLKEEAEATGADSINDFLIYHSYGSIGYQQDKDLPKYGKELEGKVIEIEYITETGLVLDLRTKPPYQLNDTGK